MTTEKSNSGYIQKLTIPKSISLSDQSRLHGSYDVIWHS